MQDYVLRLSTMSLGLQTTFDETELEAIATGPEYIDYLDDIQNTVGFAEIRRRQTYRSCFKGKD